MAPPRSMEAASTKDNELAKHDKASRGHRHHSKKVQVRQDNHLRAYYDFVRSQLSLPENFPEEELKLAAFPDDFKKLYGHARKFLCATYLRGSSRLDREIIEYGTYQEYRTDLMFWAERIYRERGLPLPTEEFKSEMTEMMRYMYAQHNDGPRLLEPQYFVGPLELRQMIDSDILKSAFFVSR